MTGTDLCAECGGPAPHRMLCAVCLPQYQDVFTDDVDPASREPCECASCAGGFRHIHGCLEEGV